ncbi:GDSL-type esterase/lipase family protein [Yinghuangia sp. YIM S10712]|uniref:GDSL-type esterase/lipase family protein n=1 Tax=Yinghuangia sp. YIM S10712 TaxID=3436930 RepID=UPI003F53AEEC
MVPEQFKAAMRARLADKMAACAAQFDYVPSPTGRVVFLGDSLTEGGLWHEWFPGVPLVNRGVGGNTIDDIRGRLDTAIIAPAAVFLLAGTNDFASNRTDSHPTVAQITDRMGALVSELRRRAPQAPLFIQSVTPREREHAVAIRQLNHAYRRIARQARSDYIDLWPILDDGTGQLRPDYTYDQLHLNGAGYAAWAKALLPYVEDLGLRHPDPPSLTQPV